jgi:hypothetical protein
MEIQLLQAIENIPIRFIISFVIGYIGYWLAYQGYETKDKTYRVLCFSIPSLIILQRKYDIEHIFYSIITIFLGILWRKWGSRILEFILYNGKISNANDYEVILELGKCMENGLKVAKLIVYLHNDTKLTSILENDRHKNKPIEHFKIDIHGNILMYVDIIGDKEEIIDLKEIVITYIPKESIRCFDLIAKK